MSYRSDIRDTALRPGTHVVLLGPSFILLLLPRQRKEGRVQQE